MHEGLEIRVEGQTPAETVKTLGVAAVAAAFEAPAQAHRVQLPKPHRPAKKSEAAPAEATEVEEVPEIDLDAEAVRGADSVGVYLREIGKIPLLNAEEEVKLAKRIEAGLLAERVLDYREGDEDERQDIRQSVLNGVLKRLVDEAKKTTAAGDASKPKSNKERAAVAQKAKMAQEQEALKQTAESMAIIERLAANEQLTKRDLKWLVTDGERAKDHLLRANLRLVVSLAKRYTGHGMPFLDLIQEGNLGVIRAVEKFDYAKGYKFSTYATWWIRQAISRAMADQSRTIRIPVHTVEIINKARRIKRELSDDLGREPTAEELAEALDITPDRVREIQGYDRQPVSLDTPVGDGGGTGRGQTENTLGDFVASDETYRADSTIEGNEMREKLYYVLSTLDAREQAIVKMRYGIGSGQPMTLDDIGREFKLSRERIRQIEREVMAKLRQPSRKQILEDYRD